MNPVGELESALLWSLGGEPPGHWGGKLDIGATLLEDDFNACEGIPVSGLD